MIEALRRLNLREICRSVRTRTDLFRVTDDRTEGIDQEVSNRRGKMSQIPEPILVVGFGGHNGCRFIHENPSLRMAEQIEQAES